MSTYHCSVDMEKKNAKTFEESNYYFSTKKEYFIKCADDKCGTVNIIHDLKNNCKCSDCNANLITYKCIKCKSLNSVTQVTQGTWIYNHFICKSCLDK